jgi:hypothetical protein
MNRAEFNVRLAARMYDMRETARNILGESYALHVGQWVALICAAQERHKCDVLPAAMKLEKAAKASGHELSDMDVLLLTAAAVEMSETDRILEKIPTVQEQANG